MKLCEKVGFYNSIQQVEPSILQDMGFEITNNFFPWFLVYLFIVVIKMPLRIIEYNSPEYAQMIRLRDEILRKPLGLHFDPEDLVEEKEDILIGAFDEDKLIGCCLLTRHNEHSCRLRQMAVNTNLQNKGIGASLMDFAENIARDKGYDQLVMHARKVAVGFYEKCGYTINGEEFYEVTIPHYEMVKRLR